MAKSAKKGMDLPIVFFYVFIAVLILCFVVVTLRIAISPVCSTDAQHTCVIDTWSIAGLTAAVFGIAAALLTFLGAFAVAYWWANLDQKVNGQVETRTNELIEQRIQDQEVKFQSQIESNVKAFETQIAQLEANFQSQIENNVKTLDTQIARLEGSFQFLRKELVIAAMYFPAWEIEGWAHELLAVDPSSEVSVRMVINYLKEVDFFLPDPSTPSKHKTLRFMPEEDVLFYWNKALEWREIVKRQNISEYLNSADRQIDQRRPRVEAYEKL
jgi:outer membrane murein-binding lipoprotein Lpp